MPLVDNFLIVTITAAAAVLFITEKSRVDLIALSVLATLLMLQLIKPEQALYGFVNTAAITVAILILIIVFLLLKKPG